MKKLIALLLILTMICTFAGCDNKMDALCGEWEMVTYLDTATATDTLELLEFYPEEIAMLDATSMGFVMIVEFNEDKTYRFAFDVEASDAMMEDYFRNCITTLYDNRASLVDTYGESILEMSKSDFQQFYAEMFSLPNFDALIDYFMDTALDHDYMRKDIEKGTFYLMGDEIIVTPNGASEKESITFDVDGNVLTLTYADGVEVYNKR